MKFTCESCGTSHDMSGVLEELDNNGVDEITDHCSECDETRTFTRGVAEL